MKWLAPSRRADGSTVAHGSYAVYSPQRGGTSHGALCDRSGRKEIPSVRPSKRWDDRARVAAGNFGLEGVSAGTAEEPGDRGDLRRGVWHRRCGTGPRALSASGICDAGANTRRGGASGEVKTICGMRDGLVTARAKLINTVRGWLGGQAVRISSGATPSFAERVREIGDLPEHLAAQLRAIDSLSREIKMADERVQRLADADPVCRRLMTVPGVGAQSALR